MPSSAPAEPAAADLNIAGVNSAGPFAGLPKLPLVPPPYPGEGLGGWVQAIADAYGLNWRHLLQTLGMPVPRRLRSLNMAPPQEWVQQLAEQTGLIGSELRARMTVGQLSRDMAALVYAAVPCRACAARIPPGRTRPVEYLADFAPWTVICKRSDCTALEDHRVGRRHCPQMYRDLELLSDRIRTAAPLDLGHPFPAVPLPLAACIEIVQEINTRLKLRVTMTRHKEAMFMVEDVLTTATVDGTSRPWPRDGRAVSAWFAWHVLTAPEEALWRPTRCRDANQAYDLLAALFEPRQIGLITPRWDYAMSLSRAAVAAPVRMEAEARQARKVGSAHLRSMSGRVRRWRWG